MTGQRHPECIDISVVDGETPGEMFMVAQCLACGMFSMVQVCDEDPGGGWFYAPTRRKAGEMALSMLSSVEMCAQ